MCPRFVFDFEWELEGGLVCSRLMETLFPATGPVQLDWMQGENERICLLLPCEDYSMRRSGEERDSNPTSVVSIRLSCQPLDVLQRNRLGPVVGEARSQVNILMRDPSYNNSEQGVEERKDFRLTFLGCL